MAGVKGRSGGARANAGGARKGAGRPPKAPPKVEIAASDDPKAFLIDLMKNQEADARMRADAAKALMPYCYPKLGEGGKKDEKNKAAKTAASGKFAAAAPPLRVVGR